MLKVKKKNRLLPLIALFALLSSCNGSNTQPIEDNEFGVFNEYYDTKWTPGKSSLNAEQPSVKNPKGEYTALNKMRRSQNKVGLPSKGEANILVVPICFKDDVQYQNTYGNSIDMTITDDDISAIKDMYFGEDNDYPSVCEYYKDSSFDKLKLSGVVSPLITLPDTYYNYLLMASNSSLTDAYNEIVSYVYNYLFVETKTYYIGDFDSDNDLKIDAISFICNYPYSLEFDNETISSLHQQFVGSENVYFEENIESEKEIPVNSYSFVTDEFRTVAYNNKDSRFYINLVGKMIGLESYNDSTVNSVSGTIRAPLGYYDMMSGAIGDHNPFSKYQLGWIEPKIINADDIKYDVMEVTLNSSITSGDALILYTGEHSLFSEYLIIDLYSTIGVNALDAKNYSIYGKVLFNTEAVRVYQVDSRLVRGLKDNYHEYESTPNFGEYANLENGETTRYIYDYAYTNNSVNEYSDYGLANYPLVSLLSKNGLNRHLTDYSQDLSSSDLFSKGDKFGSEDQIDGFYKNFAFHGDGFNRSELNISFEVKSIQDGKATLELRRVK